MESTLIHYRKQTQWHWSLRVTYRHIVPLVLRTKPQIICACACVAFDFYLWVALYLADIVSYLRVGLNTPEPPGFWLAHIQKRNIVKFTMCLFITWLCVSFVACRYHRHGWKPVNVRCVHVPETGEVTPESSVCQLRFGKRLSGGSVCNSRFFKFCGSVSTLSITLSSDAKIVWEPNYIRPLH